MSYKERILDYLWSVAPGGATNGQIARALGISSQQTVYMTTQELAGRRLIRAAKEGATWVFYAPDAQADGGAVRVSTASAAHAGALPPATFEALAGHVLGERYGTELSRGMVPGIRKRFDYVSADQQVVGDAKYYTLVGGERLPPAKFVTIAEHVWLLEKTAAPTQFLVFGNDREVPLRWLERYGALARSVRFFFLNTPTGEKQDRVSSRKCPHDRNLPNQSRWSPASGSQSLRQRSGDEEKNIHRHRRVSRPSKSYVNGPRGSKCRRPASQSCSRINC